jgi:threonine/homoserine/homoserine lactone efflux protein
LSLSDPQVLVFAVVAALLTIAPGADTFLVVRNSLRGGRRDGRFTTPGISSGLYFHALLSAVGVSVVLAQLP